MRVSHSHAALVGLVLLGHGCLEPSTVDGGMAGGGAAGATAGGATAGGATAGGATAGGATAGGAAAGGAAAGGAAAGGATAGGATAGGATAGGATAGGATAGGAGGGLSFDGGTPWLNGHLNAIQLGQWLDVSSTTNIGPIVDTTGPGPAAWLESEANKPMNNWPGKMTYEQSTQNIILTATAEGYISEVPSGAHSAALFFDLATGQFSKVWNPVNRSLGHMYDANCSRALGGFIFRRPFNSDTVFRMDVVTRQWNQLGDIASLNFGGVAALDVFPTMGAQGSLIFVGNGGRVGRYDLASNAKSIVAMTLAMSGDYPISSYFPALDAVVVGGGFGTNGSALWKLSPTGTLSLITSSLPPGVPGIGPNSVFSLLIPDPNGANHAWLIDSATTGKLYSLDLLTGVWTERGTVPAELVGRSHVSAAAIRGAGVIFVLLGRGRANSTLNLSQVFLLRVD